MTIEIFGKSAHAGFRPEDGINAISILSNSLSKIKVGRINDKTTVNFGKLYGGLQRNSVPDYVNIIGEIRSLDSSEAINLLKEIEIIFNKEAKLLGGSIKLEFTEEIRAYSVDKNSDTVKKYEKVLNNLGLKKPKLITTFGGSDNNNLNKNGIEGIVISNGMNNCHTKEEYTSIDDLYKATLITLELMIN